MHDGTTRPSMRAPLAVFLATFLLLPAIAAAQTGELRGSVTDSSGGVLPGVNVSIRQEATDVQRSIVTDDQGSFRVPALQPGPYVLESALMGFGTDTRRVVLTVGQVADVRIALTVGA